MTLPVGRPSRGGLPAPEKENQMPRKKITELRKICGLIAGHSAQQAMRAALAATDVIRRWLPEDVEIADLLHFVKSLGARLEHDRERLTAIDNQHSHELQVMRNLREERDAAASETRQAMLQLRDSLDGLYGLGGGAKVFEDAPSIPRDPVALHQLTGHVRDNLANETFPMPKPLQKGFKIDREASVADIEPSYLRLDAALKKIERAESESKQSQSTKDDEVVEVAAFTGKAVRFLEAFFDLAGLDGLSNRVRRSSHRSSSSGVGDDTSESTEDASADAESEAASTPIGPAAEPDARAA